MTQIGLHAWRRDAVELERPADAGARGGSRRAAYRAAVASGAIGPGYATEDGVGLHYTGTELTEAVSALEGSSAWHVLAEGSGGYRETRVEPTQLPLP